MWTPSRGNAGWFLSSNSDCHLSRRSGQRQAGDAAAARPRSSPRAGLLLPAAAALTAAAAAAATQRLGDPASQSTCCSDEAAAQPRAGDIIFFFFFFFKDNFLGPPGNQELPRPLSSRPPLSHPVHASRCSGAGPGRLAGVGRVGEGVCGLGCRQGAATPGGGNSSRRGRAAGCPQERQAAAPAAVAGAGSQEAARGLGRGPGRGDAATCEREQSAPQLRAVGWGRRARRAAARGGDSCRGGAPEAPAAAGRAAPASCLQPPQPPGRSAQSPGQLCTGFASPSPGRLGRAAAEERSRRRAFPSLLGCLLAFSVFPRSGCRRRWRNQQLPSLLAVWTSRAAPNKAD
ncbi:translation initiation factor IF-2-like [Leopardus geoffroyi]|uniref:translation initiation factor IF-2-like n=1 Tax=Leopardus geoffroyi TaxID=46844 RepID=UPI001E2641A4|nr:translation initiation factor IF-2-like [Leopardus geoffroyi]